MTTTFEQKQLVSNNLTTETKYVLKHFQITLILKIIETLN